MAHFQPGLSKGATLRRKYDPVGRCIFCGASDHGRNSRLGAEHIIPESLGGIAELPEAACQRCERETSKVEHEFKRHHVGGGLPHLQLFDPDKKTPKQRAHLRVNVPESGYTVRSERIALDSHLGWLFSVGCDGPTTLIGLEPSGVKMCMIGYLDRPKNDNAIPLTSSGNIVLANGLRLIAKIAHTFAVAELGLDGFSPFLAKAILGEGEVKFDRFMGYSIQPRDAAFGELHQVGFYQHPWDEKGDHVVVRVRLFVSCDAFTHYVVAGKRTRPLDNDL